MVGESPHLGRFLVCKCWITGVVQVFVNLEGLVLQMKHELSIGSTWPPEFSAQLNWHRDASGRLGII